MLALVLAAAPLRGEDRIRLTLDEALGLFRQQNPELLASTLRVRAAAGDVTTARLLPNPTVSLGVGNLPLGQTNPPGLGVGETVTSQAGIAQELVLWGKRPARIAAANGKQAEAVALRGDLERTLTFEVRARFVGLVVASERLRLARENLAQYRETVRVSQSRMRAGEIAPSDLDKIELEQRTFERELAQAEIDRKEAVTELLPLLGVQAADVEAAGDLRLPSAPEDVDTLIADALAHRPDLLAAERAGEAADAALRLARAERWPNPTVSMQYGHSQFTVSGDLANQIGAGVSVPLPVFNRNQGEVERAEAEALIARHEVDKLRLEIPQQIRAAVTNYRVARERAASLEGTYIQKARAARDAARVAYDQGAISLLEFLEAQRAYLLTQDNRLEALRDAHLAAFQITRDAALEVTK